MRAVRTIFAVFIAMSVAFLPLTGAVAAEAGPMASHHHMPFHASAHAGNMLSNHMLSNHMVSNHVASNHVASNHVASMHVAFMHMASSGDASSGGVSNAMDMTECCPAEAASHANGAPCDSAHCPLMLVCAGAGLSFAAPAFSNYVFPEVVADVAPVLTTQSLRAQTNAPPFRPPRV